MLNCFRNSNIALQQIMYVGSCFHAPAAYVRPYGRSLKSWTGRGVGVVLKGRAYPCPCPGIAVAGRVIQKLRDRSLRWCS